VALLCLTAAAEFSSVEIILVHAAWPALFKAHRYAIVVAIALPAGVVRKRSLPAGSGRAVGAHAMIWGPS
jgi:hypothetical protein